MSLKASLYFLEPLPPELAKNISNQYPWVGKEGKVTVRPSSKGQTGPYVNIIVAVLCGIIFVLLLLALVLYFKQRKLHKSLVSE